MVETGTIAPDKKSIFQRSYLLQAWLGIVLALVFGVSLATIQSTLGPVIEANKINETKVKVPELVLGDEQARKMAAENKSLAIEMHLFAAEKNGRKKMYSVYEAKFPDGRRAGWVTKANGMGYADRIELLVGLDATAATISGLFILDQKETPGLGNKIVDSVWRGQFVGKRTNAPLAIVKSKSEGQQDIDAVTGATISSRSVVDIVNKTVNDLKPLLGQQPVGRKKE